MITKSTFRMSTLAAALATAGASTLLAGTAHAQQLPSAFELVSQLDYECRPVSPAPPPAPGLRIRQLNPVLKDVVPPQNVQLGPLQQLCVPVAKNNRTPTQPALSFIQVSDLACYQAKAPAPLDFDLKLSQLNPVLKGLPDEFVRLTDLQQVCLPVRKNDAQFGAPIRRAVSYIDQACYKLEEPTSSIDKQLSLTHLNPVISDMGYPDRRVVVRSARTLCVPIAKNMENVPDDVGLIVSWADFLKYDVDILQGAGPIFSLWLTHLNPIFSAFPRFNVDVGNTSAQLMVPVAKNDRIPPQN